MDGRLSGQPPQGSKEKLWGSFTKQPAWKGTSSCAFGYDSVHVLMAVFALLRFSIRPLPLAAVFVLAAPEEILSLPCQDRIHRFC